MTYKITIGTRSSKLALWQANHVREELNKQWHGIEINLKEIKTKGDHITDVALSKIGGKGLFTKEIEDALLNGEIDLAVHSLKDLPTKLPDGLKIGAVLKRESPHDVLIQKSEVSRSLRERASSTPWAGGQKSESFKTLTAGAKIGTSSLRRIAQLKAIRPDLEYLDLRGNLDTRIRKLDKSNYDAIILAYSGVKRLDFEDRITEHFNPKKILPAVGQGTLAIEIRENDKEIERLVLKLNDKNTMLISIAERAFLERLQGGCQVPIGAYTEIENDKIILYGMIATLDGKRIIRDNVTSNLEIYDAKKTGTSLAEKLLRSGGEEILSLVQ